MFNAAKAKRLMIRIVDKKECCGCTACEKRCPKGCITMVQDDEGFLYPATDVYACIECGLCERVCPVINQGQGRVLDYVYAVKNGQEQTRLESSSGGVFTMLAEAVIGEGGVVFGVKFNSQFEVVHGYTESIAGISDFRTSKYVQSFLGDCFKEVEQFLKSGRKVLFSGTPCQISGLKRFLLREYSNLLTVDVACHGVPSPKVWRDYKNRFQERCIGKINFRDKSTGWKRYSFTIRDKEEKIIISEPFDKNVFIRGFLANIYLRPSCYYCPAKLGKSNSDITIADLWGIDELLPCYDDDKGVSLVLFNSERGKLYCSSILREYKKFYFEQVVTYNPALTTSVRCPEVSSWFWAKYPPYKTRTIEKALKKMSPGLFSRAARKIKNLLYYK